MNLLLSLTLTSLDLLFNYVNYPPKRVSLGLLVNFLLENHIFLSKNIYNHKNLPLSIKSPGLLVNVVSPLPPPKRLSLGLLVHLILKIIIFSYKFLFYISTFLLP